MVRRFDTEEVIGRVIDRNRVVCVQPFLLVEGYIIFDIAIGEEKYNWKGMYFVGKYHNEKFQLNRKSSI